MKRTIAALAGLLLTACPALAQVNNPPTAGSIGGVLSGASGGTGVANTGETITLGGNLVTGGALTFANMATANQILWASSANNVAGLATANNGVLVTSAAGVPSILSTLPSGIAATNMVLTTPDLGVAAGTSLTTTGNAAFGSSIASSARLFSRGADSGSVNYTAYLENSSSTPIFLARNDGYIYSLNHHVGGTLTLTGIAAASGADILCYNPTGGPVTYATTVLGCVPSAIRLKHQGDALRPSVALDKIMTLTPAAYTYKDTKKFGSQPYVGLYADQVCAMDERLCGRDAEGRVENYDKLGTTAYLIAAIQALQHEVASLKAASGR